jgi:hypothetical protein
VIVGDKYRRAQDEGLPEVIEIHRPPFKVSRSTVGQLGFDVTQVGVRFVEGPREGRVANWSKSYVEREFVKVV